MEILSAIVQLLGGLALFLYGIELMGDGLKNSSGAALKRVLEKVTGNVVMGVLTGALVTAVIQSSTATIVLTVALIGAGVLNLRQAVSIVMGANIGTTVTAQIIRLGSIQSDGSWLLWLFDTDTLAPIALIIGIVLLMFIKSKRSNTIGDICIGFGILFVGLNLMTSGVEPLVGTDAFIAFVRFLNNPLFGILFGLVLTVIVQSSSATVGMLQTVASVPGAGITFAMAYPVIMGINLGTCVTTAMVCSIGSSKDAKRTGVVHIAFNTIGTILFLLLMTVLRKLSVFSAEFWVRSVDSGNIANFQTIFNLVTAVVLVPFADQLVKLSMVIVKDDKQKQLRHPELHTLDEKLYNSPALAVSVAIKAVSDVGTLAKENFEKGCRMLEKYDPAVASEIDVDEDCIDEFTDRADRFFIGLSKAVETEWDDRQLDMLMQTVPNFERIGDYAENISEYAEKMEADKLTFSPKAISEIQTLKATITNLYDEVMKTYKEVTLDYIDKVNEYEESVDRQKEEMGEHHIERMNKGECTPEVGAIYLSLSSNAERVADHMTNIAYAVRSYAKKKKKD